MQWCVYIFLKQEYFKILLLIISNSRILSMRTLGDKHLNNVTTGIFLKTKNCAGGHPIRRLIFRLIQLLHPCHTSTIVVRLG
jgi:hypothetical protein